MGMKVMAVVDKAPFHTVKLVEEKRPVWYVRGPGFYCLLRTTPLEFHSGCVAQTQRLPRAKESTYYTAANLRYIYPEHHAPTGDCGGS